MTALRWRFAMVALSVSAASGLAGQAVRYGVVMEPARDTLERAWTDSVRQVERAYCVVGWSYGAYHVTRSPPYQDDSVFRVERVAPAKARDAGPSSVDFECDDGVPELHTHTPTTCLRGELSECVAGGLDAFSCQPSRADLEKLYRRNDPFAVIQCDRRAFRFYFADDFRHPASAQGQSPHTDVNDKANSTGNSPP